MTRERLFRALFFPVLSFDAWSQLSHASRFGAGRFNVSHLPALDGWLPAPDRAWFVALYLAQFALGIRVALGGPLRAPLALLALSSATTTLWSQLDSYQHHFLVTLLLAGMAGAVGLEAGTGDRLPDWGLRLVRAQVSIVYLWAAWAKVDPLWLDGTALRVQMTPPWAVEGLRAAASAFGAGEAAPYAVLAAGVLVLELGLAVGIHLPRWALPVSVLGIGFHLSVELLEFRIGLFSWFMVALYALVLPEGWFPRDAGEAPRPLRFGRAAAAGGAAATAAAVATLGFADLGPWPLVPAALALLEVARPLPSPAAWSGVVVAVALFGLHRTTDQVRDHYRYLGGDARRRGDLGAAIAAYERAVSIDPEWSAGRARLAELVAAAARSDGAARLRAASAGEPADAGD